MARIRIEFVPVQAFGLGWLGFDHLQLVFEPDGEGYRGGPVEPCPQDDWLVLEGGYGRTSQGTTLGVIGADGCLTLAEANGARGWSLVALIGTPEQRGSRIVPIAGCPKDAWDTMAGYARAIGNTFPYRSYAPEGSPFAPLNSSSLVATLLWRIGIDFGDVAPYGLCRSPGTATLLGTSGDDRLTLAGSNFDTLAAGGGDDDLSGTDDPLRIDRLYGGLGSDTVHWSAGLNMVHGGQPGLAADRDGMDTVDYRGAGTVTVCSPRVSIPGLSPDYIVTFSGLGAGGGIDWLYSIELVRLDPQTDRLVVGRGLNAFSRTMTFDMRGTVGTGNGDGEMIEGGMVDLTGARAAITARAAADDDAELTAADTPRSRTWRILGLHSIVGSVFDDTIQMTRNMQSAFGGDGDDIIDARLVAPGVGSRRDGYDAEIDGGAGNDTLIGSLGRTFARGGPGHNTFILADGAPCDAKTQTELIIAGAKPNDRLLVAARLVSTDECDSQATRLCRITGSMGRLDGDRGAQNPVDFSRDGGDLVISLASGCVPDLGTEAARYTSDGRKTAWVRVLGYHPGDLGIELPAGAASGDWQTISGNA